MTVRPIELVFPVLHLGARDDGALSSLREPADLGVCGLRAFEKGCYDNALLVDGSGVAYRVRSAIRVADLNSFSLLRPFQPRIIRASLELEAEPTPKLTLGELKERVKSALRAKSDFWQESWGVDSFAEIEARIDGFTSMAALIDEFHQDVRDWLR